jgi:TolA-binding protein
MDFTSRPLLAGAGGLIIGAVIGLGLGSSGRSEAEAEVAAQREVAANVGTLSQSVEGVDARIAALEERLGAVEGSVSALGEAQTGRIEALGQQLQGFGSDIGGQVASLGGGLADTLSERLETLKTELAAVGERLQAAPAAPAAPAEEQPAGSAPTAAAPAAPTGVPATGEVVLIGSAASFGDALSVFLSGVNAEAGTARVAVNGPVTSVLTLGEAAPAGACTLTLTGFGEGGAYLDGVCGEGGAAAPAAGQQGSAEPVTGGEAVRMGAAGSFGEGKVRIFLSGVNNEAQTARIALNGLRTAEMRLQDKVDAAGCAVTLTGIDAEGATFKVDC